jgi:hypothetical protein
VAVDLDKRISLIVQRVLRTERADAWLDAQGASEHLKMSRHHFLRLCRDDAGPEGHGEGRLKRSSRHRTPRIGPEAADVALDS